MKKFLLIGVMVLALAGCNQTAQDVATTITTATQTTKEKVKSVQGYAVAVCGYLPAAASVIGIFNSNFSQSVAVVGGAICDAATSIPFADGGSRKIIVNGIVVNGTFVK